LMKLPITYATTEALLFNNKSQYYKIPISKEAILENISSFYKIHPNDLTGKQRTQQIAHARQITMYLLRKELNLTSTEIGRYLGNRSHATVIHAITKIGLELTKNPIVKKEIIQITEILTNN
jgi:chromosomal replication initiator protein